MSNPNIRRLQALRDAALHEAMQAALDHPDDDVRGKIERIETYDRLLAAAPKRRWRELAWAVAVAVICVSLLGAGLSIRVPATRIVLEVTSGTSTMALAEPWQFNDSAAVQSPSLSLRELEEVELPAAVAVSQPLRKKRLGEFRRRPRRRLGAELRRRQHLDLRSRAGGPRGPVRAGRQSRRHRHLDRLPEARRRARRLRAEHRRRSGLPNPGDRRASGPEARASCRRSCGSRPTSPIELYDLRVSTLSFTRDVPSEPGGVEFVSTIDEGRLTLSDIGRTVALPKYELLSLRDVAGRIRRMSVGARIELVFEGKAAQALVGPDGFQQDLTPTIAEYLYHNQRMVFLWSALGIRMGSAMERTQDAGVLGAIRQVGAILCALMIFGSAPPAQEMPAAGEQLAMALSAHVVRITANWRDGSTQHGFGFVVGERNDELYIVTADHVVRGTLPDELAETIILTFFSHQGQEFQAKLLGTHDADRDVAVLLTERPGGFQLQPEIMRRSREALPARGTRVWYVGRSGRWYVPSTPGTVEQRRSRRADLDRWPERAGGHLGRAVGRRRRHRRDDRRGRRGRGVAGDRHRVHRTRVRALGASVAAARGGRPCAAREMRWWPHRRRRSRHRRAAPHTARSRPPSSRRRPHRRRSRRRQRPRASRPEEGAGEPAMVVDLDQIRRAIEADLAQYDPSAPAAQASGYQPGMLAPALSFLEPAVRVAGADRLEVDSYVTVEDLDLGRMSAVVTPAAEDLLAVAVTFERTTWRTAKCAVDFQQRAFDLTWDSRIGAFTGLRAAFAPIQVICPDLSLRATKSPDRQRDVRKRAAPGGAAISRPPWRVCR